MASLCASFARLSVGGPRALASSRNGIVASVRVAAAPKAVRIARAAVVEVVDGYKLKTRKAAAKRFKVTATGKIMRRKPGKQHINEKKGRNRLRKLSGEDPVSHSDYNNVISCLPYAGISKRALN